MSYLDIAAEILIGLIRTSSECNASQHRKLQIKDVLSHPLSHESLHKINKAALAREFEKMFLQLKRSHPSATIIDGMSL